MKVFDLNHLIGSMVVACVGVHIEGNARIGVTHQILQILNVHIGIGEARAEGMAEHMGRDVRQGLVGIQFSVLFHGPAHLVFNVERNLGIAVLVQHDEAAVTIGSFLTLGRRASIFLRFW